MAFPNMGQGPAMAMPGMAGPSLKLPRPMPRMPKPGMALKLPRVPGAGHIARNALLSGMKG